MVDYIIVLKRSVEKDLHRLPKDQVSKLMEKIDKLRSEPFPSQSRKISGAERLYRLRAGDYRIVYEVDPNEKRITIHYIRDRSVVYRNF